MLVPPTNYFKTRGASEGGPKQEIKAPETLADSKRREWLRRNFLIHRGISYPKKYFIEIKQYFDTIDEYGKGYITIDDFVEACRKEPALKSISTSLF